MNIYTYFDNKMAVKAKVFVDEKILTREALNKRQQRPKGFNVLRNASPNNPTLLEWESIPWKYQQALIDLHGDPYQVVRKNKIIEILSIDQSALEFYRSYRDSNNRVLSESKIDQYTVTASILNAVRFLFSNRVAKQKALGGSRKKDAWQKIAQSVADLDPKKWPHKLPKNPRSLERKYKAYLKDNYAALVHGGLGNDNAEKINEEASFWLLSRWADRVNKVANMSQLLAEYNEHAKKLEWKPLKHENTIALFLNREEVKGLWYGHRHGELKFKEKFIASHTTKMPSMRDSLWYSDGTKLNYFYLNDDGKVETCQVYEVLDAFSEVLLGYHISKTEDYEAQFNAYKMAIQFSGHKPYELKFDNQGGHGKLEASNFLSKIAHLALRTQPYNGKSKTIESAFGRFQQQFLKRDWFFTGQNIDTKKEESKANFEMINANKANLPSLADIKKLYKQRREEWNNAPHYKTGEARIEMYRNSVNPATPEFTQWDMVDAFWLLRKEPIKSTAAGISFKEKKQKYDYTVFENDGKTGLERSVDLDWIVRNIDKKFWIKFDPTDMSLIYLYDKDHAGDLRFVTIAEQKIVLHRNRQEQEAMEAAYFARIQAKADDLRIKTRDRMDEILSEHGMHPEDYGLNNPKIRGLETNKSAKNAAKKVAAKAAEEKAAEKAIMVEAMEYGTVTKRTSNAVVLEESDRDNYDPLTDFSNRI